MTTLLTYFALQSATPIPDNKSISQALSNFEVENHLSISFNSAREQVKIIFQREGYLLETDAYLANLQQQLEEILHKNLIPIASRTEDIEAPQEIRIPRLYGRKEIQETLGLSRQRVSKLQNDSKYRFPDPIYTQGHTVLWKAKEVDSWIANYRKNRKLSSTATSN